MSSFDSSNSSHNSLDNFENISTNEDLGFDDSGGSSDSCDFLSSVSVVTDDTIPSPGMIYTYEVRFKTYTDHYLFHEKLLIGDMVTVQCDHGYNIGFVDREALSDLENPPQKWILARLNDEDNTIKDMLKLKIDAEKNALTQCLLDCRSSRLSNSTDSIAAEFQFDHKKLTVYLKKYEDVSVCRLVRKLYDTYHMRIKVLEVDDPETMKELTKKYLCLSKLNIPLSDAFNFDLATSVLSFKKKGMQMKTGKRPPVDRRSHLKLEQAQYLIPSLAQYGPGPTRCQHQLAAMPTTSGNRMSSTWQQTHHHGYQNSSIQQQHRPHPSSDQHFSVQHSLGDQTTHSFQRQYPSQQLHEPWSSGSGNRGKLSWSGLNQQQDKQDQLQQHHQEQYRLVQQYDYDQAAVMHTRDCCSPGVRRGFQNSNSSSFDLEVLYAALSMDFSRPRLIDPKSPFSQSSDFTF